MEDLFDKGQTDLAKLLTARQRLIQLKSAEVDSIWAATQAQADLLLALGGANTSATHAQPDRERRACTGTGADCAARQCALALHAWLSLRAAARCNACREPAQVRRAPPR